MKALDVFDGIKLGKCILNCLVGWNSTLEYLGGCWLSSSIDYQFPTKFPQIWISEVILLKDTGPNKGLTIGHQHLKVTNMIGNLTVFKRINNLICYWFIPFIQVKLRAGLCIFIRNGRIRWFELVQGSQDHFDFCYWSEFINEA